MNGFYLFDVGGSFSTMTSGSVSCTMIQQVIPCVTSGQYDVIPNYINAGNVAGPMLNKGGT